MSIRPGQNRIPRPQRDIRVSTRRRRQARVLGIADKTCGFARRILDRYAAGTGHWQRLNAILQWPWIGWMLGLARPLRLVLAPRVNLAILGSSSAGPAPENRRIVGTAPPQPMWARLVYAGPRAQPPRRSISPPASAAPLGAALRRTETDAAAPTRVLRPIMEVVQRVKGRGERIEGWSPRAPRLAERPLDAKGDWMTIPRVRPVPRVVHRPTKPPLPAEPQPLAAERIPAKTSRPMSSTSPPVVDVERLTTEVVRAIDRRIIAQRERLGRI